MLIEGETGVGKELVARVIQGMGDRAGKPFVTVNCGAIPANLVESTLFGHQKGAFTGAIADQPASSPRPMAARCSSTRSANCRSTRRSSCCACIQEGEIEPVGAGQPERVNVRVISATNRRLLNLAKTGEFREDLYYRLNVFPIYVPPLRERPEDIAAAGRPLHRPLRRRGRQARRRHLRRRRWSCSSGYNWPGNIRQLENAVYRAVVLCDGA